MTGFALFTVLYLFNASTFLIDKNVHDWSPAAAVAAALAFLAAVLVRLRRDLPRLRRSAARRPDRRRAACSCSSSSRRGWPASLFAGRAAFLMVGAMLATAMSANVFFWIIPGQRKVIAQMQRRPAGRSGPRPARQAAQRAQHLLHAAGAGRDAVATTTAGCTRAAQLAGAGAADAGRRADPPFVRRPPQGAGGRQARAWEYAAVGTLILVGLAVWLAPAPPPAASRPRPAPVTHGRGQGGRRPALRAVPQRAGAAEERGAAHARADQAARADGVPAGRWC